MNASRLYNELLDANKDKDELRKVATKIMKRSFNDDSIEFTYRTENPELNVGEPTVNPKKFFVDGVRVQNFGTSAGAKVNIKGSYYDTAAETETLVSPGADLSAGGPGNGRPITVGANVIVTISPNEVRGEGVVMFTEGYS